MELSSCFILPASSDTSVLVTKCPRITQLPAVQPFNGSLPNSSGFFSLLVLTIFRDVQTSMEEGGSTWWMHSLTACIDGWKVIFKAHFKNNWWCSKLENIKLQRIMFNPILAHLPFPAGLPTWAHRSQNLVSYKLRHLYLGRCTAACSRDLAHSLCVSKLWIYDEMHHHT